MGGYGAMLMKNAMMQFRQPFASWRVMYAGVFCAMLAGCNVGPRYHPPTETAPGAYEESPTQFKETGGWTVAQPQDAVLRG